MKLYDPNGAGDPRVLSEKGVEVWAPAEDGLYASTLGRVKNWLGKTIPSRRERNGTETVYLKRAGRHYVHRLVMFAFEGVSPRRVKHLNGDNSNNCLYNLVWEETHGHLTRTEKELVLSLLNSGLTQAQVARRTGLTPSHVGYYARKLRA